MPAPVAAAARWPTTVARSPAPTPAAAPRAPPSAVPARALIAVAAVAGLTAAGAGPALAAAAADALSAGAHGAPPHEAIAQLAEGESFWTNVARYGSYFFSVLLGTAATAAQPVAAALKKPKSAAVVVVLGTILAVAVSRTVAAMLGAGESASADDLAAFLDSRE